MVVLVQKAVRPEPPGWRGSSSFRFCHDVTRGLMRQRIVRVRGKGSNLHCYPLLECDPSSPSMPSTSNLLRK